VYAAVRSHYITLVIVIVIVIVLVVVIMGNRQSMDDHLFNLRFNARQLEKEAKKAEKLAVQHKLQCKKAMEQGNIDGARIYAESAIRDKNSALNYLRLSSRIDAVAARVNTAVKMKSLTKDMSGIVNSMNSAMKSMNVEKISAVMDQFESQFENLDLSTGFMEQSMASTTTNLMPESQVDTLMREVADEHGLEFSDKLTNAPASKIKQTQAATESKENKVEEISLEDRLRKLQG